MRLLLVCVPIVALVGCGDPLRNIERLSDVPLADGATTASVAPAPEESGNAPGFLGRLFGGGTAVTASTSVPAPSTPEVAPGTVLPYGQVATVCGVPTSAMGTIVGQAAGYTLYDTASNTIALRTHYITGMTDGCARQFTAALALFGDLPTHEMIRYQPTNADIPFSATDVAYEELKGSICGAASGQPCGNAIDRFARNTAFVTVYETFGTNPEWSEVLLHAGDVIAVSEKSG
jgi:hypothetical protein